MLFLRIQVCPQKGISPTSKGSKILRVKPSRRRIRGVQVITLGGFRDLFLFRSPRILTDDPIDVDFSMDGTTERRPICFSPSPPLKQKNRPVNGQGVKLYYTLHPLPVVTVTPGLQISFCTFTCHWNPWGGRLKLYCISG